MGPVGSYLGSCRYGGADSGCLRHWQGKQGRHFKAQGSPRWAHVDTLLAGSKGKAVLILIAKLVGA